MSFPESERVLYEKNQLVEVICELRFPTVLRMESEPPASFQERIRREYPFARKTPPLISPELGRLLPAELNFGAGGVGYNFSSADKLWTVGLNSGSISLSTRSYQRWEHFKSRLASVLPPFVDEYSPNLYSRVGLRYRNLVQRRELGLEQIPWSDLLRPYIAGVLSLAEMSQAVDEAVQQLLIRLPDQRATVRINHGLAVLSETGEICYTIDNDLFSEVTMEADDATDKLEEFNDIAARIFRWCITDRLHSAMLPRPL